MRVFGIIYSIGVTFEETDIFLWLYMMQLVSEAGFNLFGNKKIITRMIMAKYESSHIILMALSMGDIMRIYVILLRNQIGTLKPERKHCFLCCLLDMFNFNIS